MSIVGGSKQKTPQKVQKRHFTCNIKKFPERREGGRRGEEKEKEAKKIIKFLGTLNMLTLYEINTMIIPFLMSKLKHSEISDLHQVTKEMAESVFKPRQFDMRK